jgi:carbonic anhydrase
MSQFVDFVGLNTFIYEISGYIPEQIAAAYATDDVSFTELVSAPGYDGISFAFAYNNSIGTFGITDYENYYNNIDPRSSFRYQAEFRDIRNLSNNKFPLHLSASMYGFPSSASYFPALMLKRNGPYGWPTFKQIRTHENPLTRKQKLFNIFTVVESPSQEIIRTYGDNLTQVIRSRYGNISGYREAMVTSKYKPLEWLVGLSPDNPRIDNQKSLAVPNLQRMVLRNSYTNDINFFAHQDLNNKLGLEVLTDKDYERTIRMYLNGGLDSDDSPLSTFEYMKFKETIFPKETNAFRVISRKRTNYQNQFWRDGRTNRSIVTTDGFGNGFEPIGATNPGYTLPSVWPLDADFNFATRTDWTTSSAEYIGFNGDGVMPGNEGHLSGGAGVLQNQYCQAMPVELLSTANPQSSYFNKYLRPAPQYSRRHSLAPDEASTAGGYPFDQERCTGSVVSLDGIVIPETASANLGSDPGVGVRFQGQALYEVNTQAGKNPFYSSYDYWWEQLRLKGKDYSVVPSFRMSDFVATISNSGSLTFIDNMFELTGGSPGTVDPYDPSAAFFGNDSSEPLFYETYSTSDFMRSFAKLKKDHSGFVDPSKITLSCKALKKFLAFDSFYPALRTVDLADQFYSSYKDYVTFTSSLGTSGNVEKLIPFQTFMKPLMAPGVLFNSIKSGIACDYPIFTSSLGRFESTAYGSSLIKSASNEDFGFRVPFEALLNPDQYLVDKQIYDNEPDPQSLTRINTSWTGQGDNLYKRMTSNFLAETVNFFLDNSSLTSVASLRQSDTNFGNMVASQSYGMRIKMQKTYLTPPLTASSTGSYYPPQNYIIGDDFARESITMYSRPSAFGPPTMGHDGTPQGSLLAGSPIGYNFPFTPPYYNGESWCDVIFHATETKKHTLSEIIDGANYYMTRVDTASYGVSIENLIDIDAFCGIQGHGSHVARTNGSYEGTYISRQAAGSAGFVEVDNLYVHNSFVNYNAMQLDSSLYMAGRAALKSDSGVVVSTITEGDPESRWIIQPKFESPILNFREVDITTNSDYDAQAPRGMWHQYGVIPRDNEGVFLQVDDIPKSWLVNRMGISSEDSLNTGSLAAVCGFTQEKAKVGQIASRKTISECVVAVPFIEVRETKKFYSIGKDQLFNAKKFVEVAEKQNKGISTAGDESLQYYKSRTTETTLNMVQKMQDFVFPPTMDFVHFDNVDPFAMYIFQFSHDLTQQDLRDIWQNLPPQLGENFEEAQSSITHPLFANQFLSSLQGKPANNSLETNTSAVGGTINNEIQWMVFKVKQRAQKNYFSKTVNESSNAATYDTTLFPRNKAEKEAITEELTSYNWPYDFFSLVELIKIDAEFTFSQVDPNDTNRNIVAGNPLRDKSSRTIEKIPTRTSNNLGLASGEDISAQAAAAAAAAAVQGQNTIGTQTGGRDSGGFTGTANNQDLPNGVDVGDKRDNDGNAGGPEEGSDVGESFDGDFGSTGN